MKEQIVGKRIIIGLMLLVLLVLFGSVMWLTFSEPDELIQQKAATVQPPHKKHETVKKEVKERQKPSLVEEGAQVQERRTEEGETNETATAAEADSEHEKPVERIVPPAFGILVQHGNIQIAGALADRDRNGTLVRYIEHICKARSCMEDITYHKDVIVARWQEEIVTLLKELGGEKMEDLSLFIENNSIKLQGAAVSAKDTQALQRLLTRLQSMNVKVASPAVTEKKREEGIDTKSGTARNRDSATPATQVAAEEHNGTAVVPKQDNTAVHEVTGEEQREKESDSRQQAAERAAQPDGVAVENKKESGTTPERAQPDHNAVSETVPHPVTEAAPQRETADKRVQQKRRHVTKKVLKREKRRKKRTIHPKEKVKDIIAPSRLETPWGVEVTAPEETVDAILEKGRVGSSKDERERKEHVPAPKMHILE